MVQLAKSRLHQLCCHLNNNRIKPEVCHIILSKYTPLRRVIRILAVLRNLRIPTTLARLLFHRQHLMRMEQEAIRRLPIRFLRQQLAPPPRQQRQLHICYQPQLLVMFLVLLLRLQVRMCSCHPSNNPCLCSLWEVSMRCLSNLL